ncbi:MAG: hypothetical protein GWM92_21265 [Gemmatimonadetes bacterium]|nr:hypothetical protein [Gemmatimonadota bacterium]NIR81388.1 hypothetical protein [Gemmatimonadota bacterium]NIT90220.1 hypothetical protein [Gemmatimonadota bacterium]NIU34048.1 hypothetical protein [Gemmatimonadota bacterium]NIU38208.1 hypothetical protein [Gemmatimonadota bacterium]
MKLAAGILIGLFYLFIAWGAYRRSAAGWDQGHSDLGFWWAVIGSFLAIAALGALVGTWRHIRGNASGNPPRW